MGARRELSHIGGSIECVSAKGLKQVDLASRTAWCQQSPAKGELFRLVNVRAATAFNHTATTFAKRLRCAQHTIPGGQSETVQRSYWLLAKRGLHWSHEAPIWLSHFKCARWESTAWSAQRQSVEDETYYRTGAIPRDSCRVKQSLFQREARATASAGTRRTSRKGRARAPQRWCAHAARIRMTEGEER